MVLPQATMTGLQIAVERESTMASQNAPNFLGPLAVVLFLWPEPDQKVKFDRRSILFKALWKIRTRCS
jgi:hypothetical protein